MVVYRRWYLCFGREGFIEEWEFELNFKEFRKLGEKKIKGEIRWEIIKWKDIDI